MNAARRETHDNFPDRSDQIRITKRVDEIDLYCLVRQHGSQSPGIFEAFGGVAKDRFCSDQDFVGLRTLKPAPIVTPAEV